MHFKSLSVVFILFIALNTNAQREISIILEETAVTGSPSLHSFAHARWNGKVLLIGGRKDGLHGNTVQAFPKHHNNDSIFVIDIDSNLLWSVSLDSLPDSMREQLQSTNMEFHQAGNLLYYIGGYGFSQTAGDHITFPFMISIQVPEL
ncbi:MAG: hypothetical protein IH946_02890, partial [Bacteroidetes bacterium]|nr:hypothetical protein [Bacteroidota bacterium]